MLGASTTMSEQMAATNPNATAMPASGCRTALEARQRAGNVARSMSVARASRQKNTSGKTSNIRNVAE